MSSDFRSRMISFRLSVEDYEECRRVCLEQGIASVSEMARAAISLFLQHAGRASHHVLESRVNEIEGRLHMLALELKRSKHPQSLQYRALSESEYLP